MNLRTRTNSPHDQPGIITRTTDIGSRILEAGTPIHIVEVWTNGMAAIRVNGQTVGIDADAIGVTP